jgi:hypothetical protein
VLATILSFLFNLPYPYDFLLHDPFRLSGLKWPPALLAQSAAKQSRSVSIHIEHCASNFLAARSTHHANSCPSQRGPVSAKAALRIELLPTNFIDDPTARKPHCSSAPSPLPLVKILAA